jgi:hypothetical protein
MKYSTTGFCDKFVFLYVNALYSGIQKADIVEI